jgi:hypothetical protein
MLILINESPIESPLPATATLSDALAWANTQLPPGKLITRIQLGDTLLEGDAIGNARSTPLAGKTLSLASLDTHELSLSMIGRLAALIEWLAPQHKQVAALLEKGDQAAAFQGLARIFSTWQNIQSGFGNVAKLNTLTLATLPVRRLHAEALMNEFSGHLTEMQKALQNRDLVMLADILQYEMDGAVANWMSLLEATLSVVQGETAAAA